MSSVANTLSIYIYNMHPLSCLPAAFLPRVCAPGGRTQWGEVPSWDWVDDVVCLRVGGGAGHPVGGAWERENPVDTKIYLKQNQCAMEQTMFSQSS